jgi:cytidylate kinase
MLITVSGPAGSGKSTLASGLADRLGYDHVSGGDIFRDIAAERDDRQQGETLNDHFG